MRRRNARRAHLDPLVADFLTISIYEVELNEKKIVVVLSWILEQFIDSGWIVDGSEDLVASKNLKPSMDLLSGSSSSVDEIALRPGTFEP